MALCWLEFRVNTEALEGIWQQDGALLTYAAVLEAAKPETLHRACELLRNLNNYQRIVDTYGYGQRRLQETLGLDDEAVCELEGYMDFEKYGTDCMENDHVAFQFADGVWPAAAIGPALSGADAGAANVSVAITADMCYVV